MLLAFRIFQSCPSLVHAVTTVRFDEIEPFNLADHVGDGRRSAKRHRRLICERLGVEFERLTSPQQVHRGRVTAVSDDMIGVCRVAGCDGLVVARTGVPVMGLSADCPLILIHEPVAGVVGVVHASWRAMVDGIVANAAAVMRDVFGCRCGQMIAGVGPSAGPCCYDVGRDFCSIVSGVEGLDRFVIADDNGGQRRFDLQGAVVHLLEREGLAVENIEIMRYCTICDHRFFSYRRQGQDAGRFGLIAAIR